MELKVRKHTQVERKEGRRRERKQEHCRERRAEREVGMKLRKWSGYEAATSVLGKLKVQSSHFKTVVSSGVMRPSSTYGKFMWGEKCWEYLWR